MVRISVPVKLFGAEIRMSTLGERLKEERARLGMTVLEFAEAAGAKKNTVIDWQKDVSSPPAARLEALAKHDLDVLYVVTGHRGSGRPGPKIEAERLAQIVEMLEAAAARTGKRWPAKKLVTVAMEVYDLLAEDPTKAERILKLVVNR